MDCSVQPEKLGLVAYKKQNNNIFFKLQILLKRIFEEEKQRSRQENLWNTINKLGIAPLTEKERK